MIKISFIFTPIFLVLYILTSCSGDKLIRDKEIRSDIETRFEEVLVLAERRSDILFNVFDQSNLSRAEEEGLKFYFSSMPLSDLADYTGDFYLENIRISIESRNKFTWSKTIPEDIFLHYVLPIRVNNENLDSFRIKFYKELYNRISDFPDLESAALEINHWCHEKVSYQGADIRTSGPMASVLSARGRCGEESTFTVAALRTVGIPARQVYVPRWAHSDDNHAWVEVWVDGKWKYLGACEPEPVLSRGWFTGPASRAMLVHTKSFGYYLGKESIVYSTAYYSEINILDSYAETESLIVEVVDDELNPVEDAIVEFKLYNYAEFYSLATNRTDSDGLSKFISGKGDLLIWCHKNGHFGFEVVSVIDTDTVQIKIGSNMPDDKIYRYNLNAPEGTRKNPSISEDEERINKSRLADEDRIRENYMSSWPDTSKIKNFALDNGYNVDEMISIITRSMGNYVEVINFLANVDDDKKDDAVNLLMIIADKDLRDTPAEILADHLTNSRKYVSDDITESFFIRYILNPRVANEIIAPWRSYLHDLHDISTIFAFKSNPKKITSWLDNYLAINNSKNYYYVPITPIGSIELGVSDELSRKILYVALCRSYGIPARLEPGTQIPQYNIKGEWYNVSFSGEGIINDRSASISLEYSGKSLIPEYYTHFTIAKLENGVLETLKFDYGTKIDDFDWPLELSPGKYVLVSGNRLNPDEVLAELRFFELENNEHKNIELNIRDKEFNNPVLEIIPPDARIYIHDNYESLYDSYGKGLVIAWIEHEREPTQHFLAELKKMAAEYNEWGGSIIIITDSSTVNKSIKIESDNELPANIKVGYDSHNNLRRSLFPEMDQRNVLLPLVLFVNSENQIIFKSEGYQLGLGDQLLTLARAQKN